MPAAGPGEPHDQRSAADLGTAVRRVLRQDPIKLKMQGVDGALLPGVPVELSLSWQSPGGDPLTLQLVEAPAGMTLDSESGVLSWLPPASAAGSSVTVNVRALNNHFEDSLQVDLQVADPTPIATSIDGRTLSVTEPGELEGVKFVFPNETSIPLSHVTISTVPASHAPAMPEEVIRLTEFFQVGPVEGLDGLVTITIPARLLPNSSDAERLAVYVHSERADDVGEPGWLALGTGLDLLPGGDASLQLKALGELSFVGLPDVPPESRRGALSRATVSGRPQATGGGVSVFCLPKLWTSLAQALTTVECTVSGDVSMTVTARHYPRSRLFPATTIEEVVRWIAAGNQEAGSLGLSADGRIEVVFERMARPSILGFVSILEDHRVLHINSEHDDAPSIKATVVHEYFHHAQSRTRSAGLDSLIRKGGKRGWWLTEGTAQWFEDEVFDELDSYRLTEPEPASAILRAGLDAHPNVSRPYSRFAFWKMVANRCPGFSVPAVLNTDLSTDPTGLKNLAARIASPAWACDFGPGFGASNRATLASALLYFSFVTAFKDDLPDLDPDEASFSFSGRAMLHQDDACSPLMRLWRLPPASAYSGTMLTSPQPDAEALLRVEPSGGEVWVSVGTKDYSVADLASSEWISTAAVRGYTFTPVHGEWRPLTLVNPSLSTTVRISVWLCRQSSTVLPWFISHDHVMQFQWGPIMRIRASGIARGPEGMEIKSLVNIVEDRAYPWMDLLVPQGSGGAVEVEGTFDLWIDPHQGESKDSEGRSAEWSFRNVRYLHGGPRFHARGDASTCAPMGGNSVSMEVYHNDTLYNQVYDRRSVRMGSLAVGVCPKK